MGWKPTFTIPGESKPSTNAQVFATKREAEESARARFMVWTAPTAWGVMETDDPVNYKFIEGKATPCNNEITE